MNKKEKPLKILIAEDDEDDRSFILRAFDHLSVRKNISFVENGEELIDYLHSEKNLPDLVFIDLNMPIMNGLQAIKIIKNDKRLKKIPVVVFTTSENKNDIDKAYEYGISSYLVKPFNFEDLLNIIKVATDYYFNISILPTTFEN